MALRLVAVGGLGLMLSPAAGHLRENGPAKVVRVHDRGKRDARRQAARAAWRAHGAALVSSFPALVGDGDIDGVVICAGKNGDDVRILRELVPLLKARCTRAPFILHLSTVSAGFVRAAHAFCAGREIAYVNYPLTGGPSGAQAASMLILASGDRELYERLAPLLNALGQPKYFGAGAALGAAVKLIGQVMVFNGLAGISGAAALHHACFGGEADAVAFFDILNAGAGGTRQWPVALRPGLCDGVWEQGFLLAHAAVDAIYAAALAIEKEMSLYVVRPMIDTALAFAFLLEKYGSRPPATQAIFRALVGDGRAPLDAFLQRHQRLPDRQAALAACTGCLPARIRETVMLEISEADFQAG